MKAAFPGRFASGKSFVPALCRATASGRSADQAGAATAAARPAAMRMRLMELQKDALLFCDGCVEEKSVG